jgi:hypothetical protein
MMLDEVQAGKHNMSRELAVCDNATNSHLSLVMMHVTTGVGAGWQHPAPGAQ